MIIGMAGHIDHGKSALVTALTGAPMDRLAEERRRGITIDLNFAPLQLDAAILAGVIDVPGHEDFVRTMVAGASGVDLVLLVIAADEGIMPQTLEHLAVLEHLRVPAGIPVLAKADLATPDELAALSATVARRLSGSPVAFDSPIAISVRTGEGLDALKALIGARSRAVRRPPAEDLFRLPVDRVFSVPGVGTVVTGTAWSGQITVGEGVTLLPARLRGRVRSIESHGRSLSRSEPGTRTAVGLAGVERSAVSRGAVVVADGAPWLLTTAVDAEIALQADAPRALGSGTRIRVLLGTTEVMARLLPRTPIEPGGTGLARLALEQPLVARGGDRFVIRSYSPVSTIGGGRVVDPSPPRRTTWPAGLAASDPIERLQALMERRQGRLAGEQVPLLLGSTPAEAAAMLDRAPGMRPAGHWWVSTALVHAAGEAVLAALAGYHAGHAESAGMPLETLRRAVHADEPIVGAAMADLESGRRIRISAGVASLPEFRLEVQGGDAELEGVVRLLDEADLAPPTLAELAVRTGKSDLGRLVRLAAQRGLVTAVERDRYYSKRALERFSAEVVEAGRAGLISPAMLRDRLGVSRKYLIPLLEWADREGITVRLPQGRRVRSR